MPVYSNNPDALGDSVTITCDDTLGRRSRAAQIRAAVRAYERDHGVKLTLAGRDYSETHGFLSRSAFAYNISRAS
jgi:hypothetical protein